MKGCTQKDHQGLAVGSVVPEHVGPAQLAAILTVGQIRGKYNITQEYLDKQRRMMYESQMEDIIFYSPDSLAYDIAFGMLGWASKGRVNE